MLKTIVKQFNELTLDQLYGILQLRSEVFVVEQVGPALFGVLLCRQRVRSGEHHGQNQNQSGRNSLRSFHVVSPELLDSNCEDFRFRRADILADADAQVTSRRPQRQGTPI